MRIVLVFTLTVALGAGCKRTGDTSQPSEATLDDFGVLPAFSFKSQTGHEVSWTGLRGKVVIANTFFTSCVTVCPKLMKVVSKLTESTKDISDLRFLSVTVDPDNDTPEALARYGASMNVDSERWTLATGPWEATHHLVVRGFRTAMGKPAPDDGGALDIAHSGKLLLVDGRGHLRGWYSTDAEGQQALLTAVRALTAPQ